METNPQLQPISKPPETPSSNGDAVNVPFASASSPIPPSVETRSVSKNKSFPVILIVFAILLGLGGYVIGKNNSSDNSTASKAKAYSFSTLDSAKTAGTNPGQGTSFSKPTELFEPVKNDGRPQTDFYYFEVKNKVSTQVAVITSISVPGVILPERELKSIKLSLRDPEVETYEQAVAPLKNTVTTKLGSAYNIKFEATKTFTSPSIKENSYQLPFTATRKIADNSRPEIMKGFVIMAISKTATYYFLEAAEAGNWDTNQKIWQQVAASLKIDQ
jgi:hypothetical protein